MSGNHSQDEQGSVPPQPTIGMLNFVDVDDTIRIMLATDNHIGYLERDPIRGQDSIDAFKEILQLAVKHDVDFILLAGDLFHENRPSRDCLYQVMALLREYTMGDRPIQIELLSDPEEGRAAGFSFPAINYEDPNFNIGIPVFSIHGNHDDPQGAGPEGALCPLDMLSVSGLINYMGKIDLPLEDADAQNTGIAVRPVLLRKGNTRLGLYSVGNVKDQRMHFELRSNRVRMFMPRDKERWFNILLLHQNRVSHGPQQSVPEGMFDDSIDLVVWGHEHDCRIVPEPVAGKRYYITQPGSSVATSLADGEAIEKHVALLKIQGKEFELTPIPLRTVRPFVLDDVVLSEAAEDEGLDLNDRMEISKYLKAKVNELIEKANGQWDERNARALEEGEPELPRMLPLVRLKVDTTGVSEMSNPVRFGQEFQGRIANPRDVLVFHRAKKTTSKGAKVKADVPELSIDDPDLTISEKLSRVRVQTLVREYLAAQELQLLGEAGMSDAIETFVDKDDTHAIQSHVNAALKALMKDVQANAGEVEVEGNELDEIVGKVREKQDQEYLEHRQEGKPSKSKGKGKAVDGGSGAESVDSMMMDVDAGGSDFEAMSEEPPKKKSTTRKKAVAAKKAPAKGRGKGKAAVASDDDEEDEDDDVEEEAPKPKRTNRAAVLSQTTTKKAPAKKAAASKASTASQSTLTFAPSGRTSRAAATKARRKVAEVVPTELLLQIIALALHEHPCPSDVLRVNKLFMQIGLPILHTHLHFTAITQLSLFSQRTDRLACSPKSLSITLPGGPADFEVFRHLTDALRSCKSSRSTSKSSDTPVPLDLLSLRLSLQPGNSHLHHIYEAMTLANHNRSPKTFIWMEPDPEYSFSSPPLLPIRRARAVLTLLARHAAPPSAPAPAHTLPWADDAPAPSAVAAMVALPGQDSLESVRLVDTYRHSTWGSRIRRSDIEEAAAALRQGQEERDAVVARVRQLVTCEKTEHIIDGERVEELTILE
ncbi:Double-strand break repair protein MRE11 [Grifola frondosa]|uniref:Double-strand break repair protein MRE11 n=1 Tax=Grifola frondosa TaxID=5627 RepID=A0A1C7LNW6_GRIFR|nr:Double-strand break repair protein MRE11 [Grifola frondosa]